MAASASLSFDEGMRTKSCWATLALGSRVSMSAMGSVIVMCSLPSPARLRHARHLARVHHLAEADAAERELAIDGAWPSATAAAGVASQRDLRPDAVALAQLEAGDGLGGLGDERLLSGDDGEVGDRSLQQRRLTGRPSDAHVDHDLVEAGHLHDVGQAQPLLELIAELVVVALLEPRPLARSGVIRRHQTSSPHFLQMRSLRPCAS